MVGRLAVRHHGDSCPVYHVRRVLLPGVAPGGIPGREFLTRENGRGVVAVQRLAGRHSCNWCSCQSRCHFTVQRGSSKGSPADSRST